MGPHFWAQLKSLIAAAVSYSPNGTGPVPGRTGPVGLPATGDPQMEFGFHAARGQRGLRPVFRRHDGLGMRFHFPG